MLEMRRLQAPHAVVATRSVKDAAVRLGYTPSAVSQHITVLERETGTVLLEPAGCGVRPTAAGQLPADHAASLLERLAEAEAALAALNAGERRPGRRDHGGSVSCSGDPGPAHPGAGPGRRP